tara:strand:- start:164 stop:472 length:309 start_codon:yes stop_codon:yes gene_type:complete
MIIECPKCKSTFKVDLDKAKKGFSKYKCSVCSHIWESTEKNNDPKLITKNNSYQSFKYLLILNIIIIAIAIVALVLYKDKLVYVDGFWRALYDFFLNLIPIK